MLNMSLGFSHDVRNVHGIGKNLVDIILTKNGYRVVNSGIKQSIRGNWDCSVEPATGCNRLGVGIPMRQLLRRSGYSHVRLLGCSNLYRLSVDDLFAYLNGTALLKNNGG